MSPSWLVIPGYLYFGVVSLFWVAALLKTAKGKSDLRFRVSVADPGPEGAPHVAVIIPARNEEANIGPCLDSVLGQDYRYTRAFVLDDGSTDHTTEILSGYADKATILKGGGGALPPGWLGKPWACQRAAEAALASTPTPDWLLFIDADVRLHPHAISASLGYVSSHNLMMLSGFGDLIMVTFWEQVMQPMIAGLIVADNPLDKVNDPARRPVRPLANGQFILLHREAWEAVGGHQAVASDVLDDVGMATAVTGKGLAYHLVFMRSLFSCRMYESFGAVWEGWTKNLFAGLHHRWSQVGSVAAFLGLLILLPHALLIAGLLGLIGAPWFALAALSVLLMQLSRAYLDHTFERPLWTGVFMPLGALLTIALFINSAIRAGSGKAVWKGRVISRAP